MDLRFSIHEIPATDILSIRDAISPDAFQAFLGAAFPELFTHVGRHGITAIGQPFVIYHAFGPNLIDAEVCVPFAGPATGDGRIRIRRLEAATIVRTLHVGPYEDLGHTYAVLSEWVEDHEYVAAGPVRERYLTGVTDDVPPSDYRTELDQPIEPVAMPVSAR